MVFGFVEKILRRTFIEMLRRKGVPDEWAQTISLKTNIPGLNAGWKRCVGEHSQERYRKRCMESYRRRFSIAK